MSIKGQGYFLTLGKVMYIQKFKPDFLRNYLADLNQIFHESFPGVVCFVLYYAKISGERLQDHWSSGFVIVFVLLMLLSVYVLCEETNWWSRAVRNPR